SYGGSDQVFLGRDLLKERNFSEQTAHEIDTEIRELILNAYTKCKDILTENRNGLDAIAEALITRESLDGVDLDEILIEVGITPLQVSPPRNGNPDKSEEPDEEVPRDEPASETDEEE
ncbi:cell division protein FtsH, partial [Candidatus Hydrogenedentota bacterium]